MKTASSYVPLHLHSNYSLLEGASTIDEYVEAAVALRLPALALTDTNALYGAVPFYRAAKSAGIKPIIGAEITSLLHTVSPFPDTPAETDSLKSQASSLKPQVLSLKPPSAVFLVRDSAGYKNLCRIVTARRLDPSFDLAAAAQKYNAGLFVLSSDIAFLKSCAGRVEGLYAELPSTFAPKPLRAIFCAARELALPLVAGADTHFVDARRHDVHKVLAAIRENVLLDNLPDSAFVPPSAALRAPSEMKAFYRLVPEALENTQRIADDCNFDFTFGKSHFPHTGVPEGETPFSHLSKLAFEGARRRYRPMTPAVMSRLAHELDVIEKLKFPEYFLIVEDIVRFARSRDIPIAGRGSAADSLVAYCLGITIVDPIRYDLYFERFLNLSRTDCPDIDLDICWKRRDEVIEYVYRKYGHERVAMISTYVTYQARSAFRDVARVYGLPLEEIDDLSKRLPHYGSSDIEEAVKVLPEAADFPIDREPYRAIVSIARRIDSYPRHLGVHLGGLVISDEPLTNYLPLQMATKGIVISQFDMHPVEDLGLVKMDLLGQRALSVVRDTVEDVRRVHNIDLDPYRLPDGDKDVARLVRRGRTIGGFQVESPGMRNLLQMMRARDKNDLLIGLSLIRPGPAASGMKEHYVRRRRGIEKPFYLHPSMREALAGTYGVMLYQEDILKVARAVAGFDLAVGDELRKAISKGRSSEAMAALRARFISGAKDRGVDERAAAAIYELVRNFAAYSYCKAHATTYAEISYATIYLKAHYPAQFHAARINNRAGFYHPRVYLEEARRMGVAVLPLDINESALEFVTGPDSIRVGFSAVKNLSRRTADKILSERARKPFESLADFLFRIDAPKSEVESLVSAGAFASLGRTRPENLFELDAFSNAGSAALEKTSAITLPEYSIAEIIALEDDRLEMTPTAHPMTPFTKTARKRRAVPARDIRRFRGKIITLAGFLVTRRRAPTKNGDYMEFVTLEDETDIFEVTLFPDAYRRFGRLLRSAGPFLVKGKVEDQYDALTVTAAFLDYLLPNERYRLHAPAPEKDEPFSPDVTVPQLFSA